MSLKQIKAELCSVWGTDRDVANQAWASTYDQEKLALKTDDEVRRIASNVVAHQHDTPKERVWMDWFITCPIFVERQFDKYRMTVQYQDIQTEFLVADMARQGVTQNELSGRYRTIPDRPYGLPKDVANILLKVAQNEGDEESTARDFREIWEEALEKERKFYETALKNLRSAEKAGAITNAEYKRVREVVRGVLGTAYLTDMRLVMNLNAFEWIVTQRIKEDAQVESQVLAYHLLIGALNNQVSNTVVKAMIEKHGWQSRIDTIEEMLQNDSYDE